MKPPALMSVLGALLLFPAASAVAADCKPEPLASLEVEFLDNGAVLLPAKVNGRTAWIYLHMSSGLPTIFPGAARELELELEPVPEDGLSFSIGDKPVTETVVIESLLLGSANFENWSMYVIPDDSGVTFTFEDAPIIGGLTSSLLSRVDVELNLAEKQVNLFKQTLCRKNQVVYWDGEVTAMDLIHDHSGVLSFPLEIEGKKVQAAFNTHSALSRISELVAEKYLDARRDSPDTTRVLAADGSEEASYRVMALTAKSLSLKNAKIQLRDDRASDCNAGRHPKFAGPPADPVLRHDVIGFRDCPRVPLTIGTDLLGKLRIYVATREGRVYFSRAPDPAAAP